MTATKNFAILFSDYRVNIMYIHVFRGLVPAR